MIVFVGIFLPASLSEADQRELVESKLRWTLSAFGDAEDADGPPAGESAAAPREIRLFGSAARGEMTESSDVDLALVFDTEEDLRRGRRAVHAAPRQDDWAVDLAFFVADDFTQRPAGGRLPMLIAREGRVLWRREEDG